MSEESQADKLAKKLVEGVPSLAPPEDENRNLRDQYGEPLFFDKKGRLTAINQPFFAALYCKLYNPVYDPDGQRFYLYNSSNGLWEGQTEERILANLAAMFRAYATKNKCPELVRLQTARILSDILVFLRAEAEKRGVFNNNGGRRFIHCANGILDFVDADMGWMLRDFSPDDYSRNRSDIEYVPDAQCPQFLERLVAPAMGADDVGLLQLYAGQCLIGCNLSQTFLMITGTTGGGKSTLVNVLEGVVGRYNCTELRLDFMDRPFETSRLIGKTLLTAKDVKSRFLNSAGASKLKALTGNDVQTAELKGISGGVDFVGCFNAIITSNSTLRVTLDDDNAAWRRRMLWIKYEAPAPENPLSDFDKIILSSEGSGVLNWALAGALKLLQARGRIRRNEQQTRRVDDLLLESDAVSSFVSDCVKLDSGTTVTSNEMLIAFNEYCDKRGWQTLPERVFQNRLPDVMLNVHRATKRNDIRRDGKGQKGYSGFALTRV